MTYYEYVTRVLPAVNGLFHSAISASQALEAKEEEDGLEETKMTTERDGNEGEVGGGGGGDGSRMGSGGNVCSKKSSGVIETNGLAQAFKLECSVTLGYAEKERVEGEEDLGMDEDSVTGEVEGRRKEMEQEREGDSIPEFGVFDIMVEIDEGPRDVYRNMMALLPPPKVRSLLDKSTLVLSFDLI